MERCCSLKESRIDSTCSLFIRTFVHRSSKASSSFSIAANRILQYLDKIDAGSGRAKRMDFFRIAGNEQILNDWVEYLTICKLVRIEDSADGRQYFVKTEVGQKLHDILKRHEYLGPLFWDLGRNRRRPK